jgi:hypothetical protein
MSDYTYEGGGGYSAPTANSTGGSNWWSSLSPQMQAAILGSGTSIVGGYLSGREERGAQRENNDAAMQRLELQLQMEREQRDREQLQRQRELGLQAQTQAPSRQDWRQRQALLAAILPNARNYSVTPPGDLSRFTPQISGGMRIPEGGFDASTLSFFSPEARVGAEADLDRAAATASGGNYSTPNYSRAGYGQVAGGLQQENQTYADKLKQQALQGAGQMNSLSPTAQARQTQSNVGANRQQSNGPSTGQRVGNAALQAALAYLGTRYGSGGGGQGGQQANPWVSAGLAGASAFF